MICEDTVKLLGVTLNKHLTFKPHIDLITKKSHGLIGVLSIASTCLSQRLLKTVYVALIRSNLEYCSEVIGMASKTQLNKLETIQKIASRVITGTSSMAHSAPILKQLGLENLEKRRDDHIRKMVKNILDKNCQPTFFYYFNTDDDGTISTNFKPRTYTGNKSFLVRATLLHSQPE